MKKKHVGASLLVAACFAVVAGPASAQCANAPRDQYVKCIEKNDKPLKPDYVGNSITGGVASGVIKGSAAAAASATATGVARGAAVNAAKEQTQKKSEPAPEPKKK